MIANALHAPTIAARDDRQSARRLLAFAAVNAARAELERIAFATDAPDWRDIEAADLLDAVHDLLAQVLPP